MVKIVAEILGKSLAVTQCSGVLASDWQLLIVSDGSCYKSPLADSLSDILLQVATGDGWAVEIARYMYPTPDDGPSYRQD